MSFYGLIQSQEAEDRSYSKDETLAADGTVTACDHEERTTLSANSGDFTIGQARVARAAHTLKGTAATLGDAPVRDIAHQLEMQARSGDLCDAEQSLPQRRSALEGLRTELIAADFPGLCNP
jgi:HPt (histidine-containing phosphotransfer) domain-containing protein